MQTRLSSSNNGFFPWLNPCYGSKFRVLGTILPKESEYEVSFDICRTPGELKKLQKWVLLKTRFLANISILWYHTLFLTSDSESTQNFASYRTFFGTIMYFQWVLEILPWFQRKTGFCCSLWIRVLSDRTEGTIEKSMFESTCHESLVFFFWFFPPTKCPTPFALHHRFGRNFAWNFQGFAPLFLERAILVGFGCKPTVHHRTQRNFARNALDFLFFILFFSPARPFISSAPGGRER